jgi:hypothetical protein
VQFTAMSKWSASDFRPKHLLDPRKLLVKVAESRKVVQ